MIMYVKILTIISLLIIMQKAPEIEINYRIYHELNLNFPSDRLSTWGLCYIMICP